MWGLPESISCECSLIENRFLRQHSIVPFEDAGYFIGLGMFPNNLEELLLCHCLSGLLLTGWLLLSVV